MSEFHEMPGHLIRRLHQISTAIFAGEMAQAGVDLTSVQYAALKALASHPGIDQNTLAGLVAYDRATMAGVVERLERRGYLRREISQTDRRARVLMLTEAGQDIINLVSPAVNRVQEQLLAALSSDESRTLISLMAKATVAGNDRARAPLRSDAADAAVREN